MDEKEFEKQSKEYSRIISKLNEDIVELESRRSNLQNEIKLTISDVVKAQDEEHKERMKKLNKEYDAKRSELVDREKYLDDHMIRLNDQDIRQKNIDKDLSEKNDFLSKQIADLDKHKAEALAQVDDLIVKNDNILKAIQSKASEVDNKEKLLTQKEIYLNTQEVNVRVKQEQLQKTLDEIEIVKADNAKILVDTEAKLSKINDEKNIIKSMLDDIEKQKEEVSKLSVYKDDLAKIQEEQKNLDKKSVEIKAFSRQVEARDVAVTEREKSAEEKAKYQMIKEREIDAKIVILKKLRESTDA